MDEQVRAFDEPIAPAPLESERTTPSNAPEQAKAVKPPRRAPIRRAVRPIKRPSVGPAPSWDLALDGKRKSSGRESEDAWLGRDSPRSLSHDGCILASPMTGVTAPRLR